MVAYFRNLEDQIKRSARRDGENRQKEEKRQARRERRSPNQVTENIISQRKNELSLLFNMDFSHNVTKLCLFCQRKKNRQNNGRRKTKFSNLDNDFMFGGNGMSNADVYRDFYGGRTRFKGCQKRVLRVSFRDLNWQVRYVFAYIGLSEELSIKAINYLKQILFKFR